MAFYIGSVNYVPGIYPLPTTAAGGGYLVADSTTSGFWAYPGSPQASPSGALETRSTFTHGYVAGGYKSANPWRSLNKTWHSNDVTIYLGEQLQQASAYSAGTFSDYNGYVHGANGDWQGSSTNTSSYSLATGIARTQASGLAGANPGGAFGYTGNDPQNAGIAYGTSGSVVGTGSWDTSVSRTFFAGNVNQTGQVGYIGGGSETLVIDKFYFPTEIMYTTTSHTGSQSANATSAYGATVGWWSFTGAMRYQTYSTDAWTTWTPGSVTMSPDGYNKMLSTKKGWHYCGTGANATTPFAKWSDSTGSTITSSLSKPTAAGEENMEMGQEWGYCLGMYNGLQNNYTWKVTYSTDANSVLGTTSQPKGHGGQSSALCSSAAATVVMNYI